MEQDCAFELGQQVVVDGVVVGDDVVVVGGGVVGGGGCCGGGGGGCCDVVFGLLQLHFVVHVSNSLLFTHCMQQQFKQESRNQRNKNKIEKQKNA